MCQKSVKFIKSLAFFGVFFKFLKEIGLHLPIYIIRKVNNNLLKKEVTGYENYLQQEGV